jgi:hypothetical protein
MEWTWKFTVNFAVFGALKDADPKKGEGEDVKLKLQDLLNDAKNNAVVKISTGSNGHFPDPAPGVPKHFGAIVETESEGKTWGNVCYACKENDTIDFKPWWGNPTESITVKHAVFGGYSGPPGTQKPGSRDVTGLLQQLINQGNGEVHITPANLSDPAPGVVKHFAATVERNKQDYYYACQEGEKINFNIGGD